MGHNETEEEEIDPLATPSGSSRESGIEKQDDDLEKKGWQTDAGSDRDYDKNATPLERTHTLGRLRFRAAEDDLPTDWWFASTAIPLIAATFAPMANLLSIAALVVSWRNHVKDPDNPALRDQTSFGYADPPWCYDLNVASLVCGFAGNLFLLFNFTRRIRYIVALPATIILFYVASGILIGITVSMSVYQPPGENDVYSQGFWHAVIAACLYLFNSMILMVNMWGYFLGHYPQHFTLTDEQRNLILQTMMFFIWLGGGAGVFAQIENWTYPDALYFCDVTILTIGFGDFFATDDLGRGLVFPYSVGGTIILGLMVSSIHKFAGELSKDNVLRKHIETRRIHTLSRAVTLNDEDQRREQLEADFARLPGSRPSISSPVPNPQIQNDLDAAASKPTQIEFDLPGPAATKNATEEPSPSQFALARTRTNTLRSTLRMMVAPMATLRKVRSRRQKVILMKEEKDRFDAMRNIQYNAGQFKKWYALGLSAVAFGILWCIGAIVFWRAEIKTQNMSYFRALYFCYVSLLTIGYGDLSPKSNAGKPFFIVWSLVAVPTMTILISDMGDTVIASFKRGTFRLADFTILPKAGLWRDFVQTHPILLDWITRRAEKKRIKKGLPVGPPPGASGGTHPTLEELAEETLTRPQMTRKLAFAIRKTADDLKRQSGKKYTYEEWVEFTRLIRFTKTELENLEEEEELEGVVEWDWLDENSPMLSEQTESEWVLDRLCESLIRLLKINHIYAETEPQSAVVPTARRLVEDNEEAIATGHDDGPSSTHERRRRLSATEGFINFFTGERRGTHAYANEEPIWSQKALEKAKGHTRRKSSASSGRKGPFGRLHHSTKPSAIGGSRKGATSKNLKARFMPDDEK